MGSSPLELLQEFRFEVADPSTRIAAKALFERVYAADVGFVPQDDFDSRGAHLVAISASGDVASCLRFLGAEERPFDIEDSCQIEQIVGHNASPALIGRFSVAESYRIAPRSIVLHLGMLKLALDYSRARGVTDLLLYTQPHLIAFYRHAFFQETGISFPYPPLAEPMQIMRLRLQEFEKLAHANASPSLQILFAAELPNFRI
jgi:predicted GNAT family N-acyltransferase